MANKTILVAQREYLDNVRTKTFWLGILAFPAIFALSIGIGWVMNKTKAQQPYAVLDLTEQQLGARIEANARANDQIASIRRFARDHGIAQQQLARYDELDVTDPSSMEAQLREMRSAATAQAKPEDAARLQSMIESLAAKYRFVPLAELGAAQGAREEREQQLSDRVRDGKLFAYFVLDGDPVADATKLTYVSNNLTDDALREWYDGATTRVVRKLRIAAANVDPKIARHLQESISFRAKQVTAAGVEDVKDEQKANKFAPVVFVYLLWIAVFTAAQMLLTNTVEEKSNRIIEVLLSSVSPGELMAGKIWGIGATGLTLILSWAICGVIGVQVGTRAVPKLAEWNLSEIVGDPLYLASFVGYFLSGYLLFASILVAIGSVCNSLKEAQNLLQPVFLLLMIPLFAMIPIVQEPNGLMARVFTYIPIYTPFAMMNRASGPPPPIEYAITTVLILVSLFVAFKAAGKIFRVGVLMTGNPPKLREILGWLRES
ncbi:MAG TPA: ABC transporter permease [Planctomycetota bacterium]|nr:ABC transporter permease [Planctomycetota bacterium]